MCMKDDIEQFCFGEQVWPTVNILVRKKEIGLSGLIFSSKLRK